MSVQVDIASRQYIHHWKDTNQDEEYHEDVPILAHSVIVQPVPDSKGAHKTKDSAAGAHTNRVGFEDCWKRVALIWCEEKESKEMSSAMHLLLDCEADHEGTEAVPKQV